MFYDHVTITSADGTIVESDDPVFVTQVRAALARRVDPKQHLEDTWAMLNRFDDEAAAS